MNAEQMLEYIQFVADRLALMLGIDVIYGSKNPFDFMDLQSLAGKTNRAPQSSVSLSEGPDLLLLHFISWQNAVFFLQSIHRLKFNITEIKILPKLSLLI